MSTADFLSRWDICRILVDGRNVQCYLELVEQIESFAPS
jgi:hypothetical protein